MNVIHLAEVFVVIVNGGAQDGTAINMPDASWLVLHILACSHTFVVDRVPSRPKMYNRDEVIL